MNQNRNNSIFLSQICVILFALLLLTLDIGGWWLAKWFVTLRGMPAETHKYLLCSLYACSPAAPSRQTAARRTSCTTRHCWRPTAWSFRSASPEDTESHQKTPCFRWKQGVFIWI